MTLKETKLGACANCGRLISEDLDCPLRDVTTAQCYAYTHIDLPLNNHKAMLPPKLKLTPQQWFSLPMAMRERWWSETNYGERQPSDKLVEDITQWLRENPNE